MTHKTASDRRAYHREYMRRYRQGLRLNRTAIHHPITAPRYDIGIGATIARAFRESA